MRLSDNASELPSWDAAELSYPNCSVVWDVMHRDREAPAVTLHVGDGILWAIEVTAHGPNAGRWSRRNWGWTPHGPLGGEWVYFPGMFA